MCFLILSATIVAACSQAPTIPAPLLTGRSHRSIRRGCQQGRVTFNAVAQQVGVLWTASPTTNRPPSFDAPGTIDFSTDVVDLERTESGQQTFSVTFRPTAAGVIDNESVLVGGVSRQGKTVIEVWQISWPLSVAGPVTNVETGVTSVELVLPGLGTQTRLYADNVAGRRYVRNVCGLEREDAATTEALVLFYDSNDLYRVDLSTGVLNLVASANDVSGDLGLIPDLKRRVYSALSYGHRTGAGYCYQLFVAPRACVLPATTDNTLILIDDNRDGELESFLALSASEYASQGWHLLSNYTEWWLE